MGISEKVAYLKGLMEGMNLNADSNEGKLFLAIADVLDEIALEVEDLTDEVMELGDGLDVTRMNRAIVEAKNFSIRHSEEYEDIAPTQTQRFQGRFSRHLPRASFQGFAFRPKN